MEIILPSFKRNSYQPYDHPYYLTSIVGFHKGFDPNHYGEVEPAFFLQESVARNQESVESQQAWGFGSFKYCNYTPED